MIAHIAARASTSSWSLSSCWSTTCWLLEVSGRSVVRSEIAASTRDARDEARRDGSSATQTRGKCHRRIGDHCARDEGVSVSSRSVGAGHGVGACLQSKRVVRRNKQSGKRLYRYLQTKRSVGYDVAAFRQRPARSSRVSLLLETHERQLVQHRTRRAFHG